MTNSKSMMLQRYRKQMKMHKKKPQLNQAAA